MDRPDGPTPDGPTDEELTQKLFEQLNLQEESAWQTLFRIHHELVRRELYRRYGGCSNVGIETQDVIQASMVKVMQALDGFEYRDHRSFRAWILRIAVNTYRKMLRSQRNAPERRVQTGDLAEAASAEPRPSQIVRKQEAEEELCWALLELPIEDHAIIQMRDIDDLSTAQIAERLGIDETTARRRHRSAFARLAKLVPTS